MQLIITRKHIEEYLKRFNEAKETEPDICCNCPVAIAARELLNDESVEVGYSSIRTKREVYTPVTFQDEFILRHFTRKFDRKFPREIPARFLDAWEDIIIHMK